MAEITSRPRSNSQTLGRNQIFSQFERGKKKKQKIRNTALNLFSALLRLERKREKTELLCWIEVCVHAHRVTECISHISTKFWQNAVFMY